MYYIFFSLTYKLGCNVSIDVGVHTPRNSLSIIFVNEAPFPEIKKYFMMHLVQNFASKEERSKWKKICIIIDGKKVLTNAEQQME